ncbi:MAG: quinone-dependent dihydroorotate dehydrogenase [Nocardioides sp.]
MNTPDRRRSPYDVVFHRAFTRVDPERAHDLAFRAIRAAGSIPSRAAARPVGAPVAAMGLRFPNALGLAAGFDKSGVGIDALAALGFGHVEIGTVTARPQSGNPKPRLFRLPTDRAILNRMGFNNDGAEIVAQRLAVRQARLVGQDSESVTSRRESVTSRRGFVTARRAVVVGVNIGKTKMVPEEDAIADYRRSASLLAPYADYLVVNVSSPNTPGLRDLQAVEKLQPLLAAVRQAADRASAAQRRDRRVPLLVKIAPDLSDDDVLAVADLAVATGLDGIVATNTTIGRHGLRTPPETVGAIGAGGLSGPPLAARSLAVLRLLKGRVDDQLTLISVGGIDDAVDARARLAAGAHLVQAYTGFVYGGPLWPARVARSLAAARV